jgi:hypothetical protein
MSNFDIAKKEAVRLLKIAKENISGDTPTLPIKNLSQAKEYIARIHGYQTWYEYEQDLKMQDSMFSKSHKNEKISEIKRVLDNLDDLNKKIPFQFVLNNRKDEEFKSFENIERKTNVIANEKLEKTFLPAAIKQHHLKHYPFYISGGCGSGAGECIISMIDDYISNKEGVILVNGDGGYGSYWKLYSSIHQANRIHDFYVLNFTAKESGSSNTIDPINDIIGDEHLFKILFGDKIGVIVNALSECVKQAGGLVTFSNLESFINFSNLQQFLNDSFFKDAHSIVESYITDTLVEDPIKTIKKHVINCMQARKMIDIILENPFVFSTEPQIRLDRIFYKRQILSVMLPCLEKDPDHCTNLVSLIVGNIEHMARRFKNCQNIQNVIYKELIYSVNNELVDYIFSHDNNNTINYTYHIYDHYHKYNFDNKCIEVSKTFSLMKMECEYPNALKLKIFDNLIINNRSFNRRGINHLNAGECFLFNTVDKNLNKCKLIYKDIKSVEYAQLNRIQS